jgi:hypothetical protein
MTAALRSDLSLKLSLVCQARSCVGLRRIPPTVYARCWMKPYGRAVAVNQGVVALGRVHVQGGGPAFWIDGPRGFSRADQDAVIHYLFSVRSAD